MTYPNGTRETYDRRIQGLDAFLRFLIGTEDGRVSLVADGKEMVAVKTGDDVEFTYEGQTEKTTGKAIVDRFRRSAIQHVCTENLSALQAALQKYRASEGHYPMSLSALVPDYIQAIPACPKAKKDTYSAGYEAMTNPDAYTITCGADHNQVKSP